MQPSPGETRIAKAELSRIAVKKATLASPGTSMATHRHCLEVAARNFCGIPPAHVQEATSRNSDRLSVPSCERSIDGSVTEASSYTFRYRVHEEAGTQGALGLAKEHPRRCSCECLMQFYRVWREPCRDPSTDMDSLAKCRKPMWRHQCHAPGAATEGTCSRHEGGRESGIPV